jgi:cardiolipin synthase
MASGIPVVAARATCIPEIVREGGNGYLVPPKDVQSLALQMERVLLDPQDMGSAARAVAERHTFVATLEDHEVVYTRLLTDWSTVSRFDEHRQAIGAQALEPAILAKRPKASIETPETQYTLFTQVPLFYENMLHAIESAREQISLMYLTFESGEWGEKLGKALCERAASGVQVRLMVDNIGLMVDDPGNAFRNRWLVDHLRENGVQVNIFRPAGWHLSRWNRLHIKVCAIDGHTAFVGGSNIGDGYLRMSDHNLRLDGHLGSTFHDVYDYIGQHTSAGAGGSTPGFRPSHLFAGQAQVRLTVPGQRLDIRRALLDIILDAERAIYIRKWYFLPDSEILDALCSQARNGVAVNILFSHHTPVMPINIANYLHGHELAKSGARVYRFTNSYMHAKVAWNDRGHVLFGSANMDDKALRSNFECSLGIHDNTLAGQLTLAFETDAKSSLLQTPGYFRRLPLRTKALSYAFSLARPLL